MYKERRCQLKLSHSSQCRTHTSWVRDVESNLNYKLSSSIMIGMLHKLEDMLGIERLLSHHKNHQNICKYCYLTFTYYQEYCILSMKQEIYIPSRLSCRLDIPNYHCQSNSNRKDMYFHLLYESLNYCMKNNCQSFLQNSCNKSSDSCCKLLHRCHNNRPNKGSLIL